MKPSDKDGVSCYVDSADGDDSKSGLSPAEAVKSQAKIGATCTAVYFKRGSVFHEKLRIVGNVRTYTNYGDAEDPLPSFVLPRTKSSGPVIAALATKGVTFDGLYLSGASGDGSREGLPSGACVVFGYQNQLTNCELTGCDTGVILYDEANLVQGNYFHDLGTTVEVLPGVDPYLLGVGVGSLVSASNSKIQYNTFINCKSSAKPDGGSGTCYGGATAVAVPRGRAIERVLINHNYLLETKPGQMSHWYEIAGTGSRRMTHGDPLSGRVRA